MFVDVRADITVGFQHTAARRRLGTRDYRRRADEQFQHTAARRRLELRHVVPCFHHGFNTQPPEGGWFARDSNIKGTAVSTHSRPKAAGNPRPLSQCETACFNTQPPEGGWKSDFAICALPSSFNTQPPEGGWLPTTRYILA